MTETPRFEMPPINEVIREAFGRPKRTRAQKRALAHGGSQKSGGTKVPRPKRHEAARAADKRARKSRRRNRA